MTTIDERIQHLTTLTQTQLQAITFDPFEDDSVVGAAKQLVLEVDLERLRRAVQIFEDATSVFADLTAKLRDIVERSTGDGRMLLNPVLGEASVILGDLAGDSGERASKTIAPTAGREPSVEDTASSPVAVAAPRPGTASQSRRLSEIADEYCAMFAAAAIKPDKLERVDRTCTRLLAFADLYREVGDPLGIPWYFIGVIHALESSFNFGRHLHNGDRLARRTINVPRGRPPQSVGDPPFSWAESATDALAFEGFNGKTDWTLPAMLFRLEKYNGFGYRMRSLASPYLWSFSDRYVKGKFVRDGEFDPDFVSDQCGAAVILKRMLHQDKVLLQGEIAQQDA